jgi:hypothetical protein
MEEEKQNKTIQSTATRTIYNFLSILKLYCGLLGNPGLHPRLYACMYIRMHTVQYSTHGAPPEGNDDSRRRPSTDQRNSRYRLQTKTSKNLVLERLSLVNNILLLNI